MTDSIDRLFAKAKSYRKRPVVVQAVQVFAPQIIRTLEGDIIASAGDWIIKGVNGEVYPCKPDIFVKTYEEEDEDAR